MDELLHRLRTDIPWALEQCINTRNRDREGEFVPMLVFPGQRKLDSLIEDVRALNLTIQITKAEGPWDDVGLGPFEPDFKLRYARIREFGPGEVYELARLAGDKTLVDGPLKIVIGKSRRQGLTSYLFGRATLRANLGMFSAICTAQKGDNAKLIFRYVTDFNDRWSKKLQKYKKDTTSESKGSWEWTHGSAMRVQTAGGRASGRGDQADWYHFSEAAFYDDYQEVIDTLSAAPRHAWVFEESTANGPQGGYYERWKGALPFETVLEAYATGNAEVLAKWNGYIRFFVSWLEDPACSLEVYDFEQAYLPTSLTESEKVLVENYGATLGNIKFRRGKIAGFLKRFDEIEELSGGSVASGLSPEQWFNQEFPTTSEEMFVATGKQIFRSEKIMALRGRARQHAPVGCYRVAYNRIEGISMTRAHPAIANLRIWEAPEPDADYILAADIGKGMPGRDPSVVYVAKRERSGRLREVALWRGAIEPVEFGYVMGALGMMYNNAFAIGEMEGPMQAAMYLLVYVLLYSNVYHRKDPTHVADSPGKDANTFTYGWNNNHHAKEMVIGHHMSAITDDMHDIFSLEVLAELEKYRRNNKGKLTAPEGDNDDCVIASSLAWYAHKAVLPPVDVVKMLNERSKKATEATLPEEKRRTMDLIKAARKREAKKTKAEERMQGRFGRSLGMGAR